jgi:hypothetical protein
MALLEVLDRHGVQYDKPETETRLKLLIKGLRRDPSFERELAAFKKQKGGADPSMEIPIPVKMTKDDFLGSEARWFVEVMGSPYAQVVVKVLFTFLFFISYLENIPIAGSLLSAVLDVTLAGGRVLIKTVQKALPPLFGLIPLPLTGLLGLTLASVFGLFLWPILAMISFSRQDFTSAIESFLRIIPPPMGDAIADAFLDANRTVYKLNDKRKKLTEDIVSGLRTVMDLGKGVGDRVKEGAQALTSQLKTLPAVPALPAVPTLPAALPKLPAVPALPAALPKLPSLPSRSVTGGRRQRFSRKQHKYPKWKTLRRLR